MGLHGALLDWYRANRRDLPWRGTLDPYRVLVAEVMLQQTQVERVKPVFTRFVKRFPTVESLALSPVAEVIRAWSGMGYNRRAVHLHRAAQVIVSDHGAVVPSDEETLGSLPGVGRYTAAAVACFGFGQTVPVVDTNVRRVLGRIVAGPVPISLREGWGLATELLAGGGVASDWNQALMDLGSSVCTARGPRCTECPVRDLCASASTFIAGSGHSERATRVAEEPKQSSFVGSSRYYRGRIVEALRAERGPVSLEELTEQIQRSSDTSNGVTSVHESTITDLVDALVRDGLVKSAESGVSLA